MQYNTPTQVIEEVANAGKAKANYSFLQLLILGIFAGAYIAFGAQLYTIIVAGTPKEFGFAITKLLGGAAFSVGLMLVILAGAELFTGNSLMIVSLSYKKVKIKDLFYNWGVVYVANFIGAVLIVYIIWKSGLLDYGKYSVESAAIKIAAGKVNLEWSEAFYRAVACNWLVCLAVWLAFASKDVVGKIFSIFFPIMVFVASGFEHCIANMYFIPIGIISKHNPSAVASASAMGMSLDSLTWSGFVTNNLIPVTLGNIVGGVVFVGFAYFLAYGANLHKKQLNLCLK